MGFFINNFEQCFIYKRKMTRNVANIFSLPKSLSDCNIYSIGMFTIISQYIKIGFQINCKELNIF